MLFIFDWDGTLSDSVGRIVAAMQAAIAEVALAPRLDAEVAEIVGLGLPEAIHALFPHESEAARAVLREAYARHYVALEQSAPGALFPGALELLTGLREQGWRLAVATGKSRKGLNRVLQNTGLSNFFDATRCADETRSKPHPRMLQELLAETGVNAAQAVMVGDTEFDLAMAQVLAMPRIGVSFGAHQADRLAKYEPLLIADQLADIGSWSRARPGVVTAAR